MQDNAQALGYIVEEHGVRLAGMSLATVFYVSYSSSSPLSS